MLAIIKSILSFFLFVAGGLAVILVGFFMLRGTMHMWDKTKTDDAGSDASKNSDIDDGADITDNYGGLDDGSDDTKSR